VVKADLFFLIHSLRGLYGTRKKQPGVTCHIHDVVFGLQRLAEEGAVKLFRSVDLRDAENQMVNKLGVDHLLLLHLAFQQYLSHQTHKPTTLGRRIHWQSEPFAVSPHVRENPRWIFMKVNES
jgi:hypothetical protein